MKGTFLTIGWYHNHRTYDSNYQTADMPSSVIDKLVYVFIQVGN